jgi:hypothetical protein
MLKSRAPEVMDFVGEHHHPLQGVVEKWKIGVI